MNGAAVTLTEEQKVLVRQAIEAATTKDEIDTIERKLKVLIIIISLSFSLPTTKTYTRLFPFVVYQAGDFSFIGVASSSSINSSASAEEASSDK